MFQKKLSSELIPSKLEELMTVEQNIHDIDIVTFKQIWTETPINYEHDIGCVRYKTDPMGYY